MEVLWHELVREDSQAPRGAGQPAGRGAVSREARAGERTPPAAPGGARPLHAQAAGGQGVRGEDAAAARAVGPLKPAAPPAGRPGAVRPQAFMPWSVAPAP